MKNEFESTKRRVPKPKKQGNRAKSTPVYSEKISDNLHRATPFLVFGAICAITGAVALQIRQQILKNTTQDTAITEKLATATEHFDFRDYLPPDEVAEICETHFVDGQQKTVLLIPDIHSKTSKELEAGLHPEGTEHQRELFALISDLLTKQKRLPIVIEGHKQADEKHKYDGPYYRANPSDVNSLLYKHILSQPTLDSRFNIAQQAVNDTPQHVALISGMVFLDELRMVGTETREMNAKKERQISDALVFEQRIMPTPEVFCGDLYPDVPWQTLSKKDSFEAALNCTCQMEEIRSELYHVAFDSRCGEVAEHEAELAVSQPEKNVLLVAGAMHAEKQLETIKKSGANYIVIKTKTASRIVPELSGLCAKGKSHDLMQTPESRLVCKDIPHVSAQTRARAHALISALKK